VIGIDRFGACGNSAEAMARFGLTARRVGCAVGELLDTVN